MLPRYLDILLTTLGLLLFGAIALGMFLPVAGTSASLRGGQTEFALKGTIK